MTRTLGTRRTVLLAGAAVLAAGAVSACSAGQVAETSNKQPSVAGINIENSDRSVLIRDLAVSYGTVAGYQQGGNAPLQFGLFNQTRQPITVTITSTRPTTNNPQLTWARGVVVTGGGGSGQPAVDPTGSRPVAQPGGTGNTADPTAGAPAPTGSATPAPSAGATPGGTAPTAAPAPTDGGPAVITLPPLGSATFAPGDPRSAQLVGLAGPVKSGYSVNLVFQFSNNAAPLTVPVGVGVPLSPVPRGSAAHQGVGEGED